MNQVLAVALGGAFGSVLRFLLTQAMPPAAGRIPYGTLFVNVSGSLLMGFLFVLFLDRGDSVWRSGILVGILGGYTTFSAFSIETFRLIEQGDVVRAGAYILLSVVLCLAATWCGVLLGRQW